MNTEIHKKETNFEQKGRSLFSQFFKTRNLMLKHPNIEKKQCNLITVWGAFIFADASC